MELAIISETFIRHRGESNDFLLETFSLKFSREKFFAVLAKRRVTEVGPVDRFVSTHVHVFTCKEKVETPIRNA